MGYKSARALEMALKAAAKESPMDTSRAITGFYFHRLLCRVFSQRDSNFLLKGGQSMLARTINARATRDIDLLSQGLSLDAALADLKRLAALDLDDFVSFEFISAEPIKVEVEYRSGLSVKFAAYLGLQKKQNVAIDLVVDEVPQEGFDVVRPVDRLLIEGLQVCDYRVYAVESSLADKFCGIVETHDGRSSSRVKDLVDICIYAATTSVKGDLLQTRLKTECAARGVNMPGAFDVPGDWLGKFEPSYAKASRLAGCLDDCRAMKDAIELAKLLFNPSLRGLVAGKTWNPSFREWQ